MPSSPTPPEDIARDKRQRKAQLAAQAIASSDDPPATRAAELVRVKTYIEGLLVEIAEEGDK